MLPTLTTPRLILRPYTEDDWLAVHAYGAEPETTRFQAWGPNTEDETRQFVARCVAASRAPDEQGYFFATVSQATGRLLGGCNLFPTNKPHGEAMIGYTLHRDFWRQGYTTEAATALLSFGFGTLNLHRIVSHCDRDNVGSWRVMEKLGMRREGHERESVWFKGRWHDWLRYAILRDEWHGDSDEAV